MKFKLFIYIFILLAMGFATSSEAQGLWQPHLKIQYNQQSPTQSIYFPLYDTITISFIGDVMQHMPQINSAKNAAKASEKVKQTPDNQKDHIVITTGTTTVSSAHAIGTETTTSTTVINSAETTRTTEVTATRAAETTATNLKNISGSPIQYDYTNTFKYMEKHISETDYMVANMELTIGVPPYSGYPMFSAPKEIAIQAQQAGIDIFMMANNHIADKGAKGLQRTLDFYKEIGVHTVGVYENKAAEEKSNPLIIDIKGVRFALFNFTYDTNGLPVPAPFVVCLEDTTHIQQVVKRAKAANADFIIALPHWGLEYHLQPSENQRKLVEFMFSLGVDAVVGSHPHVHHP